MALSLPIMVLIGRKSVRANSEQDGVIELVPLSSSSTARHGLMRVPRVACEFVHPFHVPCPMGTGQRIAGIDPRTKCRTKATPGRCVTRNGVLRGLQWLSRANHAT